MSDLCVGEGVVGEDGAEEELLLHLPRRARLLREAPEEPKYILSLSKWGPVDPTGLQGESWHRVPQEL